MHIWSVDRRFVDMQLRRELYSQNSHFRNNRTFNGQIIRDIGKTFAVLAHCQFFIADLICSGFEEANNYEFQEFSLKHFQTSVKFHGQTLSAKSKQIAISTGNKFPFSNQSLDKHPMKMPGIFLLKK